MLGLARHFHELTKVAGEYRQWTVVLLDYHAAATAAERPPRLASLLSMVRQSPVCVLRKGVRLAAYNGKPSVGVVEEWLGNLRMGEVSWSALEGF